MQVLATLQAIEARCGRARDAPRWAPRSMDLDVLLYGDLVCERRGIRLPRPDLLKRAYMLGPLAALAPEVMHPTEQRTIGELWQALRPRRAPARGAAALTGHPCHQPMLRPPSMASTCPVT